MKDIIFTPLIIAKDKERDTFYFLVLTIRLRSALSIIINKDEVTIGLLFIFGYTFKK